MSILLLIAELFIVYLLSRRLIQSIYRLVVTIARSRRAAISIVTVIFFPGTVVHELAHLFVAEVLRVRTGKLTLVPESLEGSEIKAGGVMIAETDPLRRTLIGLAPVYVGVAVLAALSYSLTTLIPHGSNGSYGSYGANGWYGVRQETYLATLIGYLLFAVSNSMFSSKEDMKGVIPFTITVGLFAVAAYVAGLRIGLTGGLLTGIVLVIETLVRSLGIVLGVNIAILLGVTVFSQLLKGRGGLKLRNPSG